MTTDETPSNGPQPAPIEQPASQQFSLKTLLAVVVGFALLFGVLTWLGLRGTGALIAFAAAGGGALAAIFCIELYWACRKMFSFSARPMDNSPLDVPPRGPGT